MIERIENVSIASTPPILLTGRTGAGETRLARKIFELKRRREQIQGEFVEVNCATRPDDVVVVWSRVRRVDRCCDGSSRSVENGL
jgi:sigma54-dependent transcription regulator